MDGGSPDSCSQKVNIGMDASVCPVDRGVPYINKLAFRRMLDEVIEYVGTENEEKLLKSIRAASNPSLFLFQLLRRVSKGKKCSENIGWISKNFKVSGVSVFRKKAPPTPIQCADHEVLNLVYRFVSMRSNPVRLSDILPLLRKFQLLDEPRIRDFCRRLTWAAEPHPKPILNSLKVPLTVGTETSQKIKSYSRIEYPLGYPPCAGQSPNDFKLTNNDWVICPFQNQDVRRRNFLPIVQVNDDLKAVENDNCILNVELCRANNVLKYFILKGPTTGYDSQIVHTEMVAIYGKRGPMMLQLLADYPTIVYPKIVARLRQRVKSLFERKLQMQPRWTMTLEKVLPQQQRKYLGVLFAEDEHSTIFAVGRDPIKYKLENTFIIAKLVESYESAFFDLYQTRFPDADNILNVSKSIISELRSNQEIKATFMHAAALCSAARFVCFFGDPQKFDDAENANIKIPVEIGITRQQFHGYMRCLRIVAETHITRRYQDAAQEMTGIVGNMELPEALRIIRAGELLLKCLIKWAKGNQMEAEIVECALKDSELRISSLVTTSSEICLDLSVVDYY